MTSVKFYVTLQEGYRDRPGMKRQSLERLAKMEAVPRLGDSVETGLGHRDVSWVDWDPWEEESMHAVYVRMEDFYSLSESFDDLLAAFRKRGWR